MKKFNFELIFKLLDNQNSNEYLDALFENGCDDATISTGQLGMLSLSFTREAINDVKKAIPYVKLVEATLSSIIL